MVGRAKSAAKAKPATRREPAAKPRPRPPKSSLPLDKHGNVAVDDLVETFGLSKVQIARSLGLPKEAVHKRERLIAPKTQQRLREMLEIVNRVSVWAGGQIQAMAWYRSQSIPALGDQTAEALVKAGQADLVREYLDGLAAGGFA